MDADSLATEALLQPGDPAPFELLNRYGASPWLLTADHAGQAIPRALGDLGLPPGEIDRHIGWDIGIAGVARELATLLDAWTILQAYSRLVIDCNRRLNDPTSIPQESDRTPIPGNRGLSAEDRRQRQEEIFTPYHMALETHLQDRLEAGSVPVVVSLHSFTPVMNGFQRPWQVGILWNRDPRV